MNPLRFAYMFAAATFAGGVLAQTPAMPPPLPANIAPPALPAAAEPSAQANVPPAGPAGRYRLSIRWRSSRVGWKPRFS